MLPYFSIEKCTVILYLDPAFVVDINNTIQLLYSLIINSATEYIADFIDGKTLVTFHDLLSCLHASWSIIINVYYDA